MISRAASSVDAPRGAPKILQVLPELGAGGVPRGAIDMAEAIVTAGGQALVASAGGRLERELERTGARHIELPLATKRYWSMRKNAGRLAELIRDEGIDLVHARPRAPAWSALWACKSTKTPLVTTWHGTYSEGFVGKRFYNSVMARGERVIAISDFIADLIKTRHKTADEKIVVIHRGVDLDVFDPERTTAARTVALAEKWRAPDDAPIILLPARIAGWKGHLAALEALAELKDRRFLCVMVGDDQGRTGRLEQIQSKIKQLGLDGHVLVAGHCADMPAAYMLADVVLNASIEPEAFGRVMAEAAAMGKPAVAFAHGGAKEIVAPGKTGWLAPPGDAKALAGAIGKAMALTAPERTSLARDAMNRARSQFSKRLMCDKTLDVYEAVIRKARSR